MLLKSMNQFQIVHTPQITQFTSGNKSQANLFKSYMDIGIKLLWSNF